MAKKKKVEPECCGNCLFGKDAGIKKYEVDVLACRRFPPQQTGTQQAPERFPYPMVSSDEWCGEHKP